MNYVWIIDGSVTGPPRVHRARLAKGASGVQRNADNSVESVLIITVTGHLYRVPSKYLRTFAFGAADAAKAAVEACKVTLAIMETNRNRVIEAQKDPLRGVTDFLSSFLTG